MHSTFETGIAVCAFHQRVGKSFFWKNKYTPTVTSQFANSSTMYGIDLTVIPRVQWNISTRWFLDLNAPLTFAGLTRERNRMFNPVYTSAQQLTSYTDLGYKPAAALRLGVGVRL